MNRRAQAQRVLIYALTAVVGAMILIFGYRTIAGLMGSGDKLMLADFRTEFTRDVDLASSYGSVQTRTYRLPAGVQELCLIDRSGAPGIDSVKYPTIWDSWVSGARENVFLLPIDVQFAVDALHVAEARSGGRAAYSRCVPVRGTVTLRMYGEGNATRVEPDAR